MDLLIENELMADAGELQGESSLGNMYATRDTCVLLRVAKKVLSVAKNNRGQNYLVLKLDAEEHALLKSRFGNYL